MSDLTNQIPDTKRTKSLKDFISNHATRSEKTSWNRKNTNLAKLLTNNVNPLEDSIRDLQLQLESLYEDVKVLRTEMVDTCVHPVNGLQVVDRSESSTNNAVKCTFCDKTMIAVEVNTGDDN